MAEPIIEGFVSVRDSSIPGVKSQRRRTTAAGLLFWGATVSIGLSTVVLLAVMSRHLHREHFAGLSTLFGLFFVASLIPSGVPLRAAALVADGAKPLKLTAKSYVAMAVVGAAVSPLIGYLLHIPVLAVECIAAQVIFAIPLAIRRGDLLAVRKFGVLAGNLFLEAGVRILLGSALGLVWGLAGLALGLAIATLIAMVSVPSRTVTLKATTRPMTSFLDTWLTLVLLGIFVQLDILTAPSGLSKFQATRYDLAAVPSKGVYLLLFAASTLAFPYIRIYAQRQVLVIATFATLALGLLCTGVLVVLRGPIGEVLGQRPASPFLLLALGAAMSIAGATGVIVYGDVALGATRPWPPLLLGILGILACLATRPNAQQFAVAVLSSQALVMFVTFWMCMRRHRGSTARSPRAAPRHAKKKNFGLTGRASTA